MLIDFSELPNSSRIWLYQSDNLFTLDQISIISNYLKDAVTQWTAHGAGLQAGFTILQNRVVVIGLNEQVNQASGCSIDASTRWFKELGGHLNLNFFDRNVFFQNQNWQSVSPFQVKNAVQNQLILPETLVLNTDINQKSELDNKFFTQAKNTWLNKYFVTNG